MRTSSPPVRLITVAFSHFCEKARWALDVGKVHYVEESHVPVFSWRATLGAGGGRTVPCLVTPDEVLPDSTDILRWVDRLHGTSLFPSGSEGEEASALEDLFDRRLGPASRRVAYGELLEHPDTLRRLLVQAGSGWEARVADLVHPMLKAFILRGLRIHPAAVERSRAVLEHVLGQVESLLSDGRRYLVGGRFTAADLTFASLATPVLLPPDLRAKRSSFSEVPDALWQRFEPYRLRPAGQFALRLYAEARGTSKAQASPSSVEAAASTVTTGT